MDDLFSSMFFFFPSGNISSTMQNTFVVTIENRVTYLKTSCLDRERQKNNIP